MPFSQFVNLWKRKNIIEGFKVGEKEIVINHIQYADDTLLFSTHNSEIMDNWRLFLFSSLTINMEKLALIRLNISRDTSKNRLLYLAAEKKYWLSPTLACLLEITPWILLLGIRLWTKSGTELQYGRVFIIGKVVNWLCWTQTSIPLYFLSIYRIPSKVSADIDKTIRDFLWEVANNYGGSHLVSWKKITAPKIYEGLGVGDLRKRNSALLSKWLWRFAQNNSALWKKIIKSKYGQTESSWFLNPIKKISNLSPWKHI